MKLLINLCAQDGIVSHNSGVGTMVKRYIYVFTKLLEEKNIDYKINLFTPEYNVDGFGYSKETKEHNINLKNVEIYELSNGTNGKKFFGSKDNWEILSKNVANVINNINFKEYDYVLTLLNDTPFGGVLSFSHNNDNHIKVWIPHSTAKIHMDKELCTNEEEKTKRINWENNATKFINENDNAYMGVVGEYIKNHLINEYSLNKEKIISIFNGEILSIPTIYEENSECKNLYNQLDKSKDILLSFGRPEKYKNLDGAIKLSEKLNVPSIIITQEYFKCNPYIDELKKKKKKTNTNLFIDVPFNFPQYIIKHYPKKIILLIPSKKEIAGLVINEIRKMNKNNILLVANNIDGLNEQIEDTKDGILVNMDNLEESALKIKEYFNSKDIIRINNNSLVTLKNKYDFEKICNKFLKELIGDMYE